VDYFYSAAKHRSRGVLWPIFTPALIAAYAVAAPYTYGDAGRNSLRGPSYTDVDFSLFRNFALFHESQLQLRAESFNLFNHPNFANPDAGLEDSNFGKITSTAGAPREFQLAATYTF
jgi:hypothetical protein